MAPAAFRSPLISGSLLQSLGFLGTGGKVPPKAECPASPPPFLSSPSGPRGPALCSPAPLPHGLHALAPPGLAPSPALSALAPAHVPMSQVELSPRALTPWRRGAFPAAPLLRLHGETALPTGTQDGPPRPVRFGAQATAGPRASSVCLAPASGLCPGSPAPVTQPTGASLSFPSFQIHLLPGRHQGCARRRCSMVERTDGWMVLSLANVTLPSPSKPKNCLLLHLPAPTSRPVHLCRSLSRAQVRLPRGVGSQGQGVEGPAAEEFASSRPDGEELAFVETAFR